MRKYLTVETILATAILIVTIVLLVKYHTPAE